MDPKTILKTLKEASIFDLFLVSFLLLPFIFSAWLGVLNKLQICLRAQYWWLVAVLVAYVVGIVAMLLGSTRARNREVARDQIIGYLKAKDFEMMSFERVREKISKAYSDEFLEGLVKDFPNELRKARLKDQRPGIARIVESGVDDEG